eukprot:1687106-Rhodomonas_salina.2
MQHCTRADSGLGQRDPFDRGIVRRHIRELVHDGVSLDGDELGVLRRNAGQVGAQHASDVDVEAKEPERKVDAEASGEEG